MIASLSLRASLVYKNYLSHYSGLNSSAWKGIVINFVESIFIAIGYFLPLYFVNELHLSIKMSGVILSCYGLGTMAGGYAGGKLTDKFSPAVISIAGLLLQSSAYLLIIVLSSPYWLMADLFLIGLGAYAFTTANYAWVLSRCGNNKNQRLKALNILGSAANLGLGLSGMLISFLADIGFVKIIFFTGVSLFLTALYLIVLEKKDKKVNEKMYENFISEENNENSSKANLKINKKLIFYVWMCLFFVGFIIAQTSSTYSIYLEKTFPDLGVKSFGILFTINTFMVVFLQTPIVDKICHKNNIVIVAAGSFLSGLGMLMLCLTYSFVFAIFSCIVMTLGEILFFAVSQLICYERSLPHQKGQSLGIYRMIYAASRAAGPAAGSFIYQSYGSNSLWLVCGLMGALCVVPSLYLQKYEKTAVA